MKGVFQFNPPVSILAYLAGLSSSCNIVEPTLAAKFPHPLSIVFLGVHIVRIYKKQAVALALATLDFELISSFFAVTH